MTRRHWVLSLWALTWVSLAGPSWGSDRTTAANDPLLPGDVIRISFWREKEFNGDYPVDELSRVILPVLGERSVHRTPGARLKRELLGEYSEQLRNQGVQITLLRRIRVLGEVRTPGLYHVDPTMRLRDVVAMAGGVTTDGNRDEIEILRAERTIESSLREGAVDFGALRSGDQILVQRRSWLSRNAQFLVGAVLSATGLIIAVNN